MERCLSGLKDRIANSAYALQRTESSTLSRSGKFIKLVHSTFWFPLIITPASWGDN